MRWNEAKEKADNRGWANIELRPTGKIKTKEQYDYVVYYESHVFQPSVRKIAKTPFDQAKNKYLRLGDYCGGDGYFFYLSDRPDGKDLILDSSGNFAGYSSFYEEFDYGKFGKIEFDEIVKNELDKLCVFRDQLEMISSYLSEYDRYLGLAFDKNTPDDCVQKLINFINDRIDCLIDNGYE